MCPQKPNDQFHKIRLESTENPNFTNSENYPQMHENMHVNMKIDSKGRAQVSYRLEEREILQKERRKTTKITDLSLPTRREEKGLKSF